MRVRNLIFLAVFVWILFPVQNMQGQPLSFLDDSVYYAWPTDATHQISSTFGETRSAHLHAGLDIRTWGREGYKVFATRDGVVYRIATGASGYGNVIYLKHDDGSFSVYAHLNRFETNLQAFTDSIRLLDYSYEMDRILKERIEYKKGDLIGYTGSTGVGPPHLHFELRTPDNEPFNPLLTNISVQDRIPPVFRQLGIEFLDPKTLKPDGYKIINAGRTGSGYSFGDILTDGPIGLAVNIHDRANYTPNAYAVYTLTMMHRADTLFHSRVDHFSYNETGDMFLDRSYPILAQTRRGFQRLYRVEGNRLPIYEKIKNEGVLALDEGTYPIKIIAADIYGNRSEASLRIHVGSKSKSRDIKYVPAYPVPDEMDKPYAISWNRLSIEGDAPLLISSKKMDFSFQQNEMPVRFSSRHSIGKTLVPGKKLTLHTPDQRLWIEFPQKALYDTLDLHLDILKSDDEIQFNFNPDRLPVNGQVYFNYILPEEMAANENLGLFSVDRFRDRLYFMGAANSKGLIRSPLREISSLVVMEDNTAPWIGRPRFGRNLAGNVVINVPTVDEKTGIDYKASTITVNGEKGIIEYDPDRNYLIFYLPGFKPERNNHVSIRVYDGVGNMSDRTEQISFGE